MKRTVLTTLAWFVANALIFAALFGLEVCLNFFSWHPEGSLQVSGCIVVFLLSLLLLGYLTQTTRQRRVLVMALPACLALLGLTLLVAGAEPTGGTELLARTAASPWWYRWGRVGVGSLPVLFWIWTLLRVSKPAQSK